jgi:hypothetical protein
MYMHTLGLVSTHSTRTHIYMRIRIYDIYIYAHSHVQRHIHTPICARIHARAAKYRDRRRRDSSKSQGIISAWLSRILTCFGLSPPHPRGATHRHPQRPRDTASNSRRATAEGQAPDPPTSSSSSSLTHTTSAASIRNHSESAPTNTVAVTVAGSFLSLVKSVFSSSTQHTHRVATTCTDPTSHAHGSVTTNFPGTVTASVPGTVTSSVPGTVTTNVPGSARSHIIDLNTGENGRGETSAGQNSSVQSVPGMDTMSSASVCQDLDLASTQRLEAAQDTVRICIFMCVCVCV